MSRPASACPWCGRSGGTCWVMPCLVMQAAIEAEDDDMMATFARATGSGLTKRGVVIIPPLYSEDMRAGG